MRAVKNNIIAILCLFLLFPLCTRAGMDDGWKKAGNLWSYSYHGQLLHGWQKLNDKWYYLGTINNRFMKSGWQKVNGSWYYLGGVNDGSMKSGWQKVNGSWYYLGGVNDGSMKSGWQKVNGSWYYLGGANDGSMKSGWQKVNGSWYYLGGANDGSMKSGWQKVNGSWYYLGEANDGSMKSGWRQVNGSWYYLGGANDGSMKSGWQKVNGSWYYLGGANDGSMKESCWIGQYYVGADGRWIPGYSEKKTIRSITMRQEVSSMFDGTEIKTDESVLIQRVSDYVNGLQQAFYEKADPLVGGGYTLRLDFEDGTYQLYDFSYSDHAGRSIAVSNGKYYLYDTADLVALWEALGGTQIE